MLLDSARGLKLSLTETVLAPFTGDGPTAKALSVPAGPVAAVAPVQPSIALGIGRGTGNDFRIAVRCQRRELMTGKEIAQIRKKARDEVDVRFVGAVTKRAERPWTQQRHRPLKIGVSVGHVKVTAGTLGAFVTRRGSAKGTLILSNNHVLANENRGKIGDAVLQAGVIDNGTDPDDRIATLAGMIRVSKNNPNAVDAAIAELVSQIECDPRTVRGLGKLAGLTHGVVTAFEVDNVVVEFDTGFRRFDGQIEIEGTGDIPFSSGGDSGSLILEAATRLAVGLLFAGTESGGSNDQGLTYANPLRTVLDALKVDLVSG